MTCKKEKQEIIYWAKALNQKGFVTARSGNISHKVDNRKILITSHDSYLGHLEEKEILLVDLKGKILEGDLELTSEKNLHLDIHNKFKDIRVVLHTHPPHTTAFFHYFEKLDIFSFEAKFYLGDIKVISQETPTVTDVEPVLRALENSNIVVLKNHGVIAIGESFKEAFSLVELLEEQAKANLLIKGNRSSPQSLPCRQAGTAHSPQIEEPDKCQKKCKMLSKEHMLRLTNLINNDSEVQELGKKYNLTCTLAVKNQDSGQTMCFYYDKGKIVKIDTSDEAEFVIIGKEDILKKVFNRQVDPFVALTQGKVRSKGDFTRMSKWYPVMVRTFKLWEKAPVE